MFRVDPLLIVALVLLVIAIGIGIIVESINRSAIAECESKQCPNQMSAKKVDNNCLCFILPK